MSIQDIYVSLEDKWYAFLDSLDSRGIPVYKIIDPIEASGIPSFPLFVGIAILIVLGIAYVGMGGGPGGGVTLTVKATSDGLALEGASITAFAGDELLGTATTDPNGEVKIKVPSGKDILIKLSKENCEEVSKVLSVSGPETVTLETQCAAGPGVSGCLGISPELMTISLMDADGYPAKDCDVYIHPADDITNIVPVDWSVDGGGYLHLSEPEECPSGDYQVDIECSNMKYEASWNDFLNDIKLGYLIMESKEEPEPIDIPEDSITLMIQVESANGIPLQGIEVKAVDESGYDLYVGGTTSGITDSLGTTLLVLPKDQEFYLTARDPNGAYHSSGILGPYKATTTQALTPITITMREGFDTIIYVKEVARQTPVAGAIVTVKYQGKVVYPETATDANGRVDFVLLKGVTYDLEVRHPRYGTATGTVEGGDNTTIWMDIVDMSKVGDLEITVINAHGMKEPMKGASVMLVKGNTTYARQTTNDAGMVFFTNIEMGDYIARIVPPGDVSYQEFDNITVNAGDTTRKTLEVIPKQVKFVVRPLICISDTKCVPKVGVHVELWNSWLEEKIDEKETDETRRVEFTLDYGTPFYIVASWADPNGKKYGPVTFSPSWVATVDKEISFNVGEKTDEATMSIALDNVNPGDNISAGRYYYLYATVSLPEFAPGTKFKEVDMEIFTGEAGSIASISRTPMVIGRIDITDLSSQDPLVVGVYKSNEYYYGKEPALDETGNSKYVKIVIGKYENANSFTVAIPVYVREGYEGPVKVNYRATWITPDGREVQSNEGLWDSVSYNIVNGTTGDLALETGDFYQYEAWLTDVKEGNQSQTLLVSNGAYFYLHFKAKARLDETNWKVTFKSLPEKVQPIAFEGAITRKETNETIYIAQQDITGWEITNSQGLYKLYKDDILEGTITLKAVSPGKTTLVMFDDIANPLRVEISEIPVLEKETIVANVTAGLEVSWSGSGMSGQIDPASDILPANGKRFTIKITLKNTANVDRHVNIIARATSQDITFDSSSTFIYQNQNILVNQSSSKTINITGNGTAGSLGKMSIYIYEYGTPTPSEPWVVINYGPVDYAIAAKFYSGGRLQTYPTEGTDEVDVIVARSMLGSATPITNVKVTVANTTATRVTGEDYFRATFPNGIGSYATNHKVVISAESAYVSGLSKSYDLDWIESSPEYPAILTLTNISLNTEELANINLTNHFKEPVKFSITPPEVEGWDISVAASLYADNGSGWSKLEDYDGLTNLVVPSGDMLHIEIRVKPVDVVCRNVANPAIVIETDSLSKPIGYSLRLSCSVTEGVKEEIKEFPPAHIVREFKPPESIDEFGCGYIDQFNTSYLCDAEQLAMAIASAADNLLSDPTVYEARYTYALGNDELTAAGFAKALDALGSRFKKVENVFETERAAELSSSHDIVFQGTAECGIVNVTLKKINMDQDVLVTVSQATSNVTEDTDRWCNRTSGHAYLVGLMNYDRDIRPLFGRYFSFKEGGDNEEIFQAIEEAKMEGANLTADGLFGYGVSGMDPASIVSSITGGQAQSFVKWKVCSLKNSFNCPSFATSYLASSGKGIVGYMRIDEFNDVYIGMVYDPSKIPIENNPDILKKYEAKFLARLMEWVSTGEANGNGWGMTDNAYLIYYPENDTDANLIDLEGPTVSGVEIRWISDFGDIKTDVAGDRNVTVRVTVSNDAERCYIANVQPDGTMVGSGGEGDPEATTNYYTIGNNKVFYIENWELLPGSGTKKVAAFCVDGSNVVSDIGYATIKLDVSGVELLGRLPETVLMFNEFEEGAINFKVMNKYFGVSRCWLEWPEDSEFPPTEGQMDKCNDDVDDNKNGNVSDGCCDVVRDMPVSLVLEDVNVTITRAEDSPSLSGITSLGEVSLQNRNGKNVVRLRTFTVSVNEIQYSIPTTEWIYDNNELTADNIYVTNTSDGSTFEAEITIQGVQEKTYSLYNIYDVTCNSPVLSGEDTVNRRIPINVVCENDAGEVSRLGQIYLYKYAAGVPRIFLPREFGFGWFKGDDNKDYFALDQPIAEGGTYEWTQG